jgi:phasin family protein
MTKNVNPFADMTKIMADCKLPRVDLDAVLTSQRKNMEALGAAGRLTVEGMQAVVKRQSEIVGETMDAYSKAVRALVAEDDPRGKAIKQAELIKGTFDSAIANARGLADIVASSGARAFGVIVKRASESLDEAKSTIAKPTTAKSTGAS